MEVGGVVAVVVARSHPDDDLIASLAGDRPDVDLARRHHVLHLAGDWNVREVRVEVQRRHRFGGSRIERRADLVDQGTLERAADAGDEVRQVADVRRVEGDAAGVQRGEVEPLRLGPAKLLRREVLAARGDVRLLVQLVRIDLRRLLVAHLLRRVHAGPERRVRRWVVGITAAGLGDRVARRAERSLLAFDLALGDALRAFEGGADDPHREGGPLARDPTLALRLVGDVGRREGRRNEDDEHRDPSSGYLGLHEDPSLKRGRRWSAVGRRPASGVPPFGGAGRASTTSCPDGEPERTRPLGQETRSGPPWPDGLPRTNRHTGSEQTFERLPIARVAGRGGGLPSWSGRADANGLLAK